MEWLGMSQIPFVMLFTKTDKLGVNQLQSNIAAYKKKLLEEWEEMPQYILTSSVSKLGKDDVLAYVDETNKLFPGYQDK
jgi:GTP-binding protein